MGKNRTFHDDKRLIQQENIIILNVYAPNFESLKIHEAKIDRTSRRNR